MVKFAGFPANYGMHEVWVAFHIDISTLKKVGPFLVAFAAADLRTESLDPDVPPLVSSYCHAALTSLEEAIAHLEPWRPLVGLEALIGDLRILYTY